MVFFKWKGLIIGIAASTGVALVSALYLHSRKNILNGRCAFKLPNKIIHIVNSSADWEGIYQNLCKEVEQAKVVGLDCEWVSGPGHPVALIQLAAPSGLCLLIRIFKLSQIPDSLSSFLADRSILKVGVACVDDGRKLQRDYGLLVRGCVDLRNLVVRNRNYQRITSNGLGLKDLADKILGVKMDKSIQTRCSDWEAENLSQRQIDYAADDACVGVGIFCELILQKFSKHKRKELDAVFFENALSMCQGIVDVNYKQTHRNHSVQSKSGCRSASNISDMSKVTGRAYSSRKKPLYHNCQLWAPDGQILCTCDTKKADWYLKQGLGEKVSDEPYIVQLKFEPAGRPGSIKNYYVQVKTNNCAVCGKNNSYVRKHIVPKEYRKHFPSIMKDHRSHDVLLLCTVCHQQSTLYDDLLRQQFAVECQAPIGTENGVKYKEDRNMARIRSSAKAILKSADQLPLERRQELEQNLRDYFGTDHIDEDLLNEAAGLDSKIPRDDYVAHGEKVVKYMVERGRLVEFEKVWRQHFIDSMKPKFLPAMWSVHHNHDNLLGMSENLKQAITS